MSFYIDRIQAAIAVKTAILNRPDLLSTIESVGSILAAVFKSGGKVLFCGNGGSAADAQHLAAELSGRFYRNRAPLFAEALHVNTSYVTAVANDFGYDRVYERLVQAFGRPGDALIGMSTSGMSENVRLAVIAANEIGMTTVALTGERPGEIGSAATYSIAIPSRDTPRIQEAHMVIGHIMCEWIEANLFPA